MIPQRMSVRVILHIAKAMVKLYRELFKGNYLNCLSRYIYRFQGHRKTLEMSWQFGIYSKRLKLFSLNKMSPVTCLILPTNYQRLATNQ